MENFRGASINNTVFLSILQYIETLNSYMVFSEAKSVFLPHMLVPQLSGCAATWKGQRMQGQKVGD